MVKLQRIPTAATAAASGEHRDTGVLASRVDTNLHALTGDEVTTECPQIATPQEFSALLDTATTRFLDTNQPTDS
jgi:hypothetical protein